MCVCTCYSKPYVMLAYMYSWLRHCVPGMIISIMVATGGQTTIANLAENHNIFNYLQLFSLKKPQFYNGPQVKYSLYMGDSCFYCEMVSSLLLGIYMVLACNGVIVFYGTVGSTPPSGTQSDSHTPHRYQAPVTNPITNVVWLHFASIITTSEVLIFVYLII